MHQDLPLQNVCAADSVRGAKQLSQQQSRRTVSVGESSGGGDAGRGKSAGQVCGPTLKCKLISDLDFGHIASFIPPSNHLHHILRVLDTPEDAREAATGHIRDEGLIVEHFDTVEWPQAITERQERAHTMNQYI